MKYVLLLLLLTSCGPHLNIESKYQPYVDAFEKRAAMVGVPVKVTDLTILSVPTINRKDVIGNCSVPLYNFRSPTITISQEYWVNMDVYSREQLIFHEMGHCVLGRTHRSELNNHLHLSIMHPFSVPSDVYKANYVQYIHELFIEEDLQSELPLQFERDDFIHTSLVDALFAHYGVSDAN
jgi:hypothetical protein